MYINEELLKREYDNPKIKLKDMLIEFINNADEAWSKNKENMIMMIETVGCFNHFCRNEGFKELVVEHSHSDKNGHIHKLIKDYLSEFLITNTDLYQHYFPSYKYEFKPEKLEEIKGLLQNIKQDIISNHNQAENTEIIIEIIDEMENDLKLKTNTLNNIKGKLILLHAEVTVLGVDTDELKSKIISIYKMLFEADTFINTVISLKNHWNELKEIISINS